MRHESKGGATFEVRWYPVLKKAHTLPHESNYSGLRYPGSASTHFFFYMKKIWNPFKIWNSSIISLSWLNTVKYYMTHKLVRPHVKSQLLSASTWLPRASNSHVVSSGLPASFLVKPTLQKHEWFKILFLKFPFAYQIFIQTILVTTESFRILPSDYLTLIFEICFPAMTLTTGPSSHSLRI